MKEYRKIQNLFKFDEKFKSIVDINEPFKSLKDLYWIGTEKVDGTNIRIHWDGHNIEIGGRTDNAQFQGDLLGFLEKQFKTPEAEYVFEQIFEEKDAVIFGEGYGPKIQNGGGLYCKEPKFIIFDIDVDGYHLSRGNVIDISSRLGYNVVPVVFEGTLEEAQRYVAGHPASVVGENGAHEMEGIVLELPLELYDKKGERLKCKCKYRDMLKGGLVKQD